VACYSFTVEDFHLLLFAQSPGALTCVNFPFLSSPLERKCLAWPIGEQLDKLPGLEEGMHSKSHHLGDPGAGEARGQHGVDVGQQQRPFRRDGKDRARTVELPLERVTRQRVTEPQAGVIDEIPWALRPSLALEIGGRREGEDPCPYSSSRPIQNPVNRPRSLASARYKVLTLELLK
jgi:hypothetical protein